MIGGKWISLFMVVLFDGDLKIIIDCDEDSALLYLGNPIIP